MPIAWGLRGQPAWSSAGSPGTLDGGDETGCPSGGGWPDLSVGPARLRVVRVRRMAYIMLPSISGETE